MDTIRIGNDVQVVLGTSSFEDVNPKNIVSATCVFVKNNKDESSQPQVPTIHEQPQYTIHNCNDLCYNVYPCNNNGRHCSSDPRNCGFVVNKQCQVKHVVKCIVRDGNIYAVLPAEMQKHPGTYDCKFEIKVYKKGWDFDNVQVQTNVYNDVFALTYGEGKTGSITIHLNPEVVDTWVLFCTDGQLIAHDPDYSHLTANAQSFKLYQDETYYKDLRITQSGRRIVVMSSHDDLCIEFSLFKLPVKIYKVGTLYIYVSEYTYGEQMRIKIHATGVANEFINNSPAGTYVPEEDFEIHPKPPVDPETPNRNTIDGDTLILFGQLDENDTLVVQNQFDNNTLTL